MSDAAWAASAAVIVATIGSVLGPIITHRMMGRMGRKVDDIHHTALQNSNTDDPKTMRDEIHWLIKHAKASDARLADGTMRFRRLEATIGLPDWVEK